jgi:hypothetical protein
VSYPRQVNLEAELFEEIFRHALAMRLQLCRCPIRHGFNPPCAAVRDELVGAPALVPAGGAARRWA